MDTTYLMRWSADFTVIVWWPGAEWLPTPKNRYKSTIFSIFLEPQVIHLLGAPQALNIPVFRGEMPCQNTAPIDVHIDGYRQYRWPCITTTIPAEPGMSGDFVYVPKDGETIAACGVVCADNSSTNARTNQSVAGESVIGLTYMALGLVLPETTDDDSPHHTLQSMMRQGRLTPAIGGFEQFNIHVE